MKTIANEKILPRPWQHGRHSIQCQSEVRGGLLCVSQLSYKHPFLCHYISPCRVIKVGPGVMCLAESCSKSSQRSNVREIQILHLPNYSDDPKQSMNKTHSVRFCQVCSLNISIVSCPQDNLYLGQIFLCVYCNVLRGYNK